MTLEIFEEIDQQSDEWRKVRMGIPTASMFATVMAGGRGGGESKTRDEYMRKLAGEIITGIPAENYKNAYMARGNEMEAELRDLYAMGSKDELKRIGFARNGRKGCSPDSLVGANGLLEVKSQAPHLLILTLQANIVPNEHVPQLQGNMWVLERDWVDLRVGYSGMPNFKARVKRDEQYIRRLSDAVDAFNKELDTLVARIKKMGGMK